MDGTLSAAIAEYINQRKQAKLEPLQKSLNKVLEKSGDPVTIATAKAEYHEQADTIEAAYDPVVWLTDAAAKAYKISIATHVPKFTHSSAKASSFIVLNEAKTIKQYVTTSCLNNIILDFSVSDAKLLSIAGLLQVQANGDSLLDQVQKGHVEALLCFTEDTNLQDEWLNGFSKALGDDVISSHTLMKQLYFPISKSESVADYQYHLLCPIYSSSLSHELSERVHETRNKNAGEVRKARRNGVYDRRLDISFLTTAVQKFGGDNAQNVSQLNSKRNGRGYLLNCSPPAYQAQTKPPLNSQTLYNREFGWRTSRLVQEFKAFLAGLTEKDRNFKTRYQRDYGYTKPLIDALLNFAAEIQTIPNSAGWTSSPECNMKRAHQLFLDIDNPDAAFQREREQGDWLDVVASDFANWLLRKLENKSRYVLGDVEQRYFKKLCLNELRAFERMGVAQEENHA